MICRYADEDKPLIPSLVDRGLFFFLIVQGLIFSATLIAIFKEKHWE